MSEGTQNISDEQPVVGEPASHPHQAVVMGEPPEDVAPVLGEPAFANGLQDQQLIPPPSTEETSANGVQSSPRVPFHEEGLASLAPSSHVSAPSSAASVEESPNSQHASAANASESGITHPLEPPADSHVDEVSSALDDPVVGSTETTASTHNTVRSTADDIPEFVEVSHIVDSPSEAPLPPWSEFPTQNPFEALDEGPATAPGEILTGDTPSTQDEICLKGLGDQQEEASLSSAAHEKQLMENPASTQTGTDDAVNKDVCAAELSQVGQGDTLAQESNAKEASVEEDGTGSSAVEHPLTGGASEIDHHIQGNDTSEDIPVKAETGHISSREATPKKDILNETHDAPITSESNEEIPDEAPLKDLSVAPQGTRDIAVEECSANQSPAAEATFPPAANGDNGYQDGEDDVFERELQLAKDGDDASGEVEKPSSRSKLPLIFTGLAIAAVGVVVASISRPH